MLDLPLEVNANSAVELLSICNFIVQESTTGVCPTTEELFNSKIKTALETQEFDKVGYVYHNRVEVKEIFKEDLKDKDSVNFAMYQKGIWLRVNFKYKLGVLSFNSFNLSVQQDGEETLKQCTLSPENLTMIINGLNDKFLI